MKEIMKKMTYELSGMMIYNEQMIMLKGHLTLDHAGNIEGIINENPGKRRYDVEGRVADMPEENSLALDLLQVSDDTHSNIYLLTKDYSGFQEGIVPIEGQYNGVRIGQVPVSVLRDESLSFEERMYRVMEEMSETEDDNTREVVIDLIYKDV